MDFPQNKGHRLFVALSLAACVAVLGVALKERFTGNSYDSLQSLSASALNNFDDPRVVVVYLDLNSFGLLQQDPIRPWSRALHAQLLRKLTSAGAKAVVFDIVFGSAGLDATADEDFASAIRANGRTLLAGESSGKISHETDAGKEWVRASTISPPYDRFATAAAGWGIASHIVDDDYVVRRYVAGGFGPDEQGSLTWAVATFLKLPVTQRPDAMGNANGKYLRYYGPPLTIPHVSYAEGLATDGTPQDFFRDKIVFIGARPLTALFRGRQDEFRSPFHSWANRELFMPGVEVHATEMLNLLRSEGLERTSPLVETSCLLLAAVLFGGGLIWVRPILAAFTALVGMALVLGVSMAVFARGVWFPWLIVAGVQIPAALGGSVLFQSIEWYRERRRYEARIREQAALIDKAHDAILVQALDGKILYANPSAERLYGWSLGELQRNGTLEELLLPDHANVSKARAMTLDVGEWNGELRQQTKAGRIVIVASRWTLICTVDGKPKELLLINSDVTEQKDLEQQFLRTQRMNTIGTLAGGMAHDLNNALAPILMGTQLLRRRATNNETRELLSLMETNTHRGADMVRQVLLFARGRGGEFEPVEPGALVRELEKMVRETFPNSIAVETFLPKDLWLVRGNPTQLHQVLLNLCVNARDAMPGGGKLSFVADNVELSTSEAAEIPDGTAGKFVSLAVSDTGTGMSPEVLAKIFEPFFSTKGEGLGTGIGLATVMRIVKAHGGFLRVESELDQGTTFEVFLPQANIAAPTAVARPIQELPRGNGEMILVADDEQAIRELMKSELMTFGYRVKTASNGADAVAMFRLHQAEVRLLITDNAMPVMDGRQAIAEIRTLRPGLPVIYTSGGSAEKLEGVTELVKPFPLEELLVAIQRSLGAKSS